MAHIGHFVPSFVFFTEFEVEEAEEVSEFLGPPGLPPDVAPCCRRAGSTCPGPRRVSRRARGSPPRGR